MNLEDLPPPPDPISARQAAANKRQWIRERGKAGLYWAASKPRWADQTGTAHVIYNGATLCGARPYSMGGSFHTARAAGCHECKRCVAIINDVFPEEPKCD